MRHQNLVEYCAKLTIAASIIQRSRLVPSIFKETMIDILVVILGVTCEMTQMCLLAQSFTTMPMQMREITKMRKVKS